MVRPARQVGSRSRRSGRERRSPRRDGSDRRGREHLGVVAGEDSGRSSRSAMGHRSGDCTAVRVTPRYPAHDPVMGLRAKLSPGPRPRHTGRPVRPADARRDSGVAAVAGSVTNGVPDRRGGGASSNGCCTTASGGGNSPAARGGSRRHPHHLVDRGVHVGGDRLQSGAASQRCRRRSRPAERRRDEHPTAAARPWCRRNRPTAA